MLRFRSAASLYRFLNGAGRPGPKILIKKAASTSNYTGLEPLEEKLQG